MINLIAAASENNVIGIKGKMPWHYPEDLAYFKKVTLNHPIVMGRKTFESIGRVLPNRQNIILSKNKDINIEGVEVFNSIPSLLEKYKGQELFIIGGEKIYKQFISIADRIYLTRIHKKVEGDAYFPAIPTTMKLIQKTKGKNSNISFLIFEDKK